MKKEQIRNEYKKKFLIGASEIYSAIERAKLVSDGSQEFLDKAARDSVKQFLRNNLPEYYYVGEGCVIDTSLNESPYHDIIIADRRAAEPLFRLQNGIEYFAVESLYAVGDVKFLYSAEKKQIENFNNNLAVYEKRLKRLSPPSNLTYRFKPETQRPVSDQSTSNIRFFSFMVFVQNGNFNLKDIQTLYNNTMPARLPSNVCFLDRGILEYTHIENGTYERLLDFNYPEIPLRGRNRWVLQAFEDKSLTPGNVLSVLYYNLLEYLKQNVLPPADIREYLEAILDSADYEVIEKTIKEANYTIPIVKTRKASERAAAKHTTNGKPHIAPSLPAYGIIPEQPEMPKSPLNPVETRKGAKVEENPPSPEPSTAGKELKTGGHRSRVQHDKIEESVPVPEPIKSAPKKRMDAKVTSKKEPHITAESVEKSKSRQEKTKKGTKSKLHVKAPESDKSSGSKRQRNIKASAEKEVPTPEPIIPEKKQSEKSKETPGAKVSEPIQHVEKKALKNKKSDVIEVPAPEPLIWEEKGKKKTKALMVEEIPPKVDTQTKRKSGAKEAVKEAPQIPVEDKGLEKSSSKAAKKSNIESNKQQKSTASKKGR